MLASAPSIPATTTTTSAPSTSSADASRRCTPATPTSVSRSGSMPCAHSVAAHSSATGRSAVPAVANTTRSGRGAAGRQTTVVPRTVAPGFAAVTASSCSGEARVSSTGLSPSRSSSVTIAAHCSGVLPGP